MHVRTTCRAGLLAALLMVSATGMARPSAADVLQQAEAIRSADPAKFAQLVGQLQERREELPPAQREQLSYLQAYRLAFAGRYEEAIGRLKELNVSSPVADIRFRSGALLVNIYAKTRRFTEGLRQLGDTLVHIEKISDPELRVHALTEAAYIHNEVGQYRLGMHYAERILESEPVARTRCFAEYLRFDAMLNLGILPASDAPLAAAIDDCASIGETILANSNRTTLARKWVGERKREAAIALLRKHLPEVEAARYPYLAVQFKALLAELMFERGDMGAAETFASETVALSGSVGNTYSLVNAYQTLYRIAERRHDDETALVYYRRYAEADKAFLNEVKARELAYQIVRQETLEKSQQIQRLDSQNQLLLLQRKLETQAGQNTRLVVILLVMLLMSSIYWAYRTKRTQMLFKRLAETDALTGVCNRNHFTVLGERKLAQCARAGQEASLVMFDLDHFKEINDRYGHAAGDRVLRQVAEIGRDISRRIDAVGRLGGEEFAFLITDCDLAEATRLAEAYREQIIRIETTEGFQVTASFGVASSALVGYQLEQLMSCTDKMLYRSKHEGRNRVSVFDSRMGAGTQVRPETLQPPEWDAADSPVYRAQDAFERLGT